jgi:hypothetical protein
MFEVHPVSAAADQRCVPGIDPGSWVRDDWLYCFKVSPKRCTHCPIYLAHKSGCHLSATAHITLLACRCRSSIARPSSVKQIFSSVGGDVLHGAWLDTCADVGNPVRQARADY